MLTKVLTKAAPVTRMAMQTRNMTVVSAPPAVRVSFAEKIAHGVIMTAGYLAIPCWVLVNLQSYKSRD